MTSCLRQLRLASAFFIIAGLCKKISTVLNNLTSRGDQSAGIGSCLGIESSTAQLTGGGNQVVQSYVENWSAEKLGFWSRDLKLSFFGCNIFFLPCHNIVVHHVVLLIISVGD